MPQHAQRHLVIFARFPRLGAGKRRLAAGIGDVGAVGFQRVRLAILMQRFSRDPRWCLWLAVTPDGSGPWPHHIRVMPQGRGDLGVRLARVMAALPVGPVIVIGSDIVGITPSTVARAFAALAGRDAVLGPADDGGYGLIGLSRTRKTCQPFGPVRWSTQWALADTLANLEGARVALVDRLEDVDTGEDLARAPNWQRLCPTSVEI